MNTAISYLQGVVSGAKTSFETDLKTQNTEVLMKESNKVSAVLGMMDFCKDECQLSFRSIKVGGDIDANTSTCFNSCVSKSFEMKQIESFNRSIM